MRLFLCAFLMYLSFGLAAQSTTLPIPKGYVCHQSSTPITIDGEALENDWQQASFTDFFVDIEGSKRPKPRYNTRVKMLWDSAYLYFYAEMEEPHLWATITKRDAVIFHDNDFEIFIDPNGDTQEYYEFEMNALNTIWDLLLTKAYRDGGKAVDDWDIKGIKTAVHLKGTLNDPSDTDEGWSVEVAMPWSSLKEAARTKTPPREGDQWRINFSRVEWDTDIIDGKYAKKKNANTGKYQPENNWVWSPQRIINMHEPEFWGIVQFTAKAPGTTVAFEFDKRANLIRHSLFGIHRAQKGYARKHKRYASSLEDLGVAIPVLDSVTIKELKGFDFGYILLIHDSQSGMDYYLNETGLIRRKKL